MPQSSFLFTGDQALDKKRLCDFIDGYAETISLPSIEVDDDAIDKVVKSFSEMPWPNGVGQASAFKKVGMLATSFAFYTPIITEFKESQFGILFNHQNAIVAYEIAKAALWNATITCPYRGEISLTEKIFTSKHFWREMISTLSSCNPRDHFACFSLLFESLVYRSNPKACYTALFGKAYPDMVR